MKPRPMRFRYRRMGEKEWREGEGTVTSTADGRLEFRIPPSILGSGETIVIDYFTEDIRES